MNLLIFGDSVMRGALYHDEKFSPVQNRFETMLTAGHTVKNHAKIGHTAQNVLLDLKRKLPAAPAEDTLILLGFGGNDCNFCWAEISKDPYSEHFPATKPSDFVSLYQEAIDTVKSAGLTPVLTNLVPLDAPRFMAHISRGLDRERIASWLGDESMLYRWQEHYSCLVCDIARENGLCLLDIRTPFLLSHRYSHLMGEDGIHPTEEGYRLIEETIQKKLL